jgi:tRNA(fMet)-specific endonuclease VapC
LTELAIDSNAAIDWLRPNRPDPKPLLRATQIVVPLPVLGELVAGAWASARPQQNRATLQTLISKSKVIAPDIDTAETYGRLRGLHHGRGEGWRNDLWIAALCIQHDLPLLTNDRDFDRIEGLRVVHW